MAVTPVKLSVDGFAEREVQSVTYEFDQAIDTEGQITGIPRGGKITVRVKALNDGNAELLGWMLERNLAKSVKIAFNETKSGKQMKQYEINGAYCVDYHENWTDKEGHYEEIVMTCQHIKFAKAEFDNAWA